MRLPLLLCRGCGQHYFRVMARQSLAGNTDTQDGYYPVRVLPERQEGESDEDVWYLTDALHTEDEEIENPQDTFHLCRYCGSLLCSQGRLAIRTTAIRCGRHTAPDQTCDGFGMCAPVLA